MNIFETMDYINGFSKLGEPIKDLSRFKQIMDALGNPQKQTYFVHVAGTNGKGSTVRMISNTLSFAGYKTGEYTSPFIKVYNDRMRVNGIMITDEELCEIVTQIYPIINGLDIHCSQFEITTAIAFIYFAAKKCDVVVLETGLGGLLDCTNIIEKPLVSVITSVSFDHTGVLGDTLDAIARQKAGIIKMGCPVVMSPNQNHDVHSVMYSTALVNETRLKVPNTELLVVQKSDYTGNEFIYKGFPYQTIMLGHHQIDNALTAIETCRVLKKRGFPKISYLHIHDGVKSAQVPSRCQVLKADKPFIMIDGAHNPDGMKALADFIREIPKEPKVMVCGMMEDKDWETAIGFITRYIDYGICVDGFAPKTVFAPKLADMFIRGETSNLKNAVTKAVEIAGEHGMVIIAGSLYLASTLQQHLG